ncbi:MAG: nucleotidyltransferase [Verrucomicrobia bacterium]|nr:MAG: nucleotidyltransferase [Verrucomicrobiota bacterium]
MRSSTKNLSLLVLAAGMGSRYGGLKQMDPVGPNGEAVLEYSVYDALQCGFNEVIFVLRREFEEPFREQVLSRFSRFIPTITVFQDLNDLPGKFTLPEGRRKPWGTGHAVWCARKALKQPFIAINADDFYGRNAFQHAAWFFSRPGVEKIPAFMMAGFQLANTLSEHGPVSRGICRTDDRGMLQKVEEWLGIEEFPDGIASHYSKLSETHRFTGEETVSLNFWGLTPTVIPLLEQRFYAFLEKKIGDQKAEFYLPDAISDIVSHFEATVAVLPTKDRWLGITYREDKPSVTRAIANLVQTGDYPSNLWGSGGIFSASTPHN